MKELTMNECEEIAAGMPPVLIALATLTFAWANENWADIKKGAMDGWNDATR